MIQPSGKLEVRSKDEALHPDFVAAVKAALASNDTQALLALSLGLHKADLADLLELLKRNERRRLITRLGEDFDFSVLVELQDQVRDEIVEALPNIKVAEAVSALESDDAVQLLENLDAEEQSNILGYLPARDQAPVRRGLDFPEDSAGRLMRAEFVAVPPYWKVGQAIDFMREETDLPTEFSEIFVVDPAFRLLGTVRLDRLLRTGRPVSIETVMGIEQRNIQAQQDQEDVARTFERYNLVSAPVIDGGGRLVGVVTIDDVVDVIQEEAEEDIHRLGGVGDESVSDTVLDIAQSRFTWLLVNLATAILASMVIALFNATIEQMVALAVLMPIVASMGGNAGTQTMTVAVRALATRDLGAVNARRIVTREALVGLINGVVFALVMALVVYIWFGLGSLALVIAIAMVVNMLVAGLAGILIPLTLDHLEIDPAIASSVFLTTLTDVVGFFSFLGLASLWF